MSAKDIAHHIDRLKESFLCAAARGGRIHECVSLLDLGAELEWPPQDNLKPSSFSDHDGNDTPLLASVRNGHSDVAALLLAHGADPFRCSSDGDNVLHLVAKSQEGDEGMASLFAPNANVLVALKNGDGMTPIDVAVARGRTSLAEFLSGLCEGSLHSIKPSTDFTSDHEQTESTGADACSIRDVDSYSRQSTESSTSYNAGNSCSCSSEYDIDETLHFSYEHGDPDTSSEADATHDDLECDESNHYLELQNMTELAHSQSIELYQAKFVLNEALQEKSKFEEELRNMKLLYGGQDGGLNIASKSIAELASLEEHLKKMLEMISKRKEELSASLEEERSCVICKEQPKTVVLLGCRHLCVCSDCGKRDELDRCPLCREIILERIDVFQ